MHNYKLLQCIMRFLSCNNLLYSAKSEAFSLTFVTGQVTIYKMLTKFILTVDGQEYELQPQDVVNWEDIECSYKRSDYSGVIRSFMSQFQFAENAYTLILDSYRQKGMSSCVSVAVLVIDNSWEYHEAFRCDMDMTTLSFTSTIATLTAVDNSVAAQIKANKSTKYEFKIGSDITPDVKTYRFDRLNMTETATYSITDGESQDDGSLYGIYKSKNNGRIYVGLINSELAIGGAVLCNDDQVYKDGHMLRALKKVNIKLEYSITVSIMRGCGTLTLMKNENVVKVLHEGCEQNKPWRERDFGSEEELMGYITSDAEIKTDWAQEKWDGKWVTINGIVWVCRNDAYHNGNWWDCTGETREQYISKASSGIVNISLEPGDEIWLRYSGSDKENFSIYKSELKFSWKVRGESVDIVNIEPIELLRRLLEKMGIDATYCSIEAQQHSFLSSVRLLPAEGIRGISDARITTSFNDFCTWLETVFGYVYEINKFGSVSFMHRDKLFNPHAEVHEISDARDFEYSIEKSVVYSSLVVGYNKQDYEGVNGRDEFNFSTSYTFDLPIDGKKLELKSPYRADSYGIEFLAE